MFTVILNSRQHLRPTGGDLWVRETVRAVDSLDKDNDRLLTSVGQNSWELTLFLAVKYDIKRVVYLPLPLDGDPHKMTEYYREQYRLDAEQTDYRFIDSVTGYRGRLDYMKRRDMIILKKAERLIPVSVQSGGNMDKYLNALKGTGKEIDRRFSTDYCREQSPIKNEYPLFGFDGAADTALKDYLVHWTRTANGPWPQETRFEYYDSVLKSANRYSHDSLLTLINILKDKTICASSRHMPKDVRAVSFSALRPSRAMALMRWRARYREMTFEPYGIAIDINYARSLGIRKVIYGHKERSRNLAAAERPFFQSNGRDNNWPREREYRHRDDLRLDNIPRDKIKVIVRRSEEKGRIAELFDGPVVSLYK
jgi:hypothetical protein